MSGRGAAAFLERLCANRVARDVGQITYTQMLNPRGGIECDFTVTRLAEDRFRIVTGTAFGQHDLAWIRQHAPEDGSVDVSDVTSQLRLLRAVGAAVRATILQPLTTTSLANEAFPYMQARELAVGSRPVPRAPRDLRRRARLGALLPDRVRARALGHDLGGGAASTASSRAATRRSTRSGSRRATASWGADITPEDTPFEAGLGFAVKLDKGEFIGRERACRARRARAATPLPHARRPAGGRARLGAGPGRRCDRVGRVTSGGYGYTVEKSIAYAYLPAEHRGRTEVEVEIFGEWVPGVVADEPLLRPAGRADPRVSALDAMRRARVAGRGRPVEVLGGGITNHNLKVEVGGETFVLRVAGKDTGLLGIDRGVELAATSAAAALGIGPEVVAFVEPEGWLVTRFVEGEIRRLERMREPDDARAGRAALRAFHDGPAMPGDVRLVPRRRDAIARRRSARGRRACPPPSRGRRRSRPDRGATRSADAPVPCHNDLLNANFIDDGERLRIVDWEYAGMGDRFFDLANFSINHELDAERERASCSRAYFGEVRTRTSGRSSSCASCRTSARRCGASSSRRCRSSTSTSTRYAAEHFARLERTAAAPAFVAALEG